MPDYDDEYDREYDRARPQRRMPDYGDEPPRYQNDRYESNYGQSQQRQPQQTPSPKKTVIYFDYKQHSVPANGMNLLQMHAQFLQQNPQKVLSVEGHTDGVASASYNRQLGLKRAQSVANTLMQMGVLQNQLNVTSYGQERPARQGGSDSDKALNRRVELIYR